MIKQLTCASIFSGGCLADIGMRNAGFRHLWSIEMDSNIANVARINGYRVITSNVANVNPTTLEKPDLLWASPPCQSYSPGRDWNLHPRADANIGLVVIDYLKILQPKAFILENVRSYGSSQTFKDIINALYGLGYFVNISVVNAADYGVPQTRERLFLRAIHGELIPFLPQPLSIQRSWYDAIKDLIPSMIARNDPPNWSRSFLDNMTIDYNRRFIINLKDSRYMGEINQDKMTLRYDNEPSFTIIASGGVGTIYMHDPSQDNRVLSARAHARIQTLPNNYVLPSSNPLATKIVGNGVPCLLAQVIASSMLSAM